MPEEVGVPQQDPAQPLPRLDPAAIAPGGPGKTTAAMPEEFTERLRALAEAEGGTLLPGRNYEEADMARAALAALRGWAARRERLATDRADLMAAAWWSGHRNLNELARAAGGISRTTVYEDLRSRGIEPTDKAAAHDPRPHYAPLNAKAMGELAELSKSATLPAMLVNEPNAVTQTAWALSGALERIAELLDTDSENMCRYGRDEVAHDLAARLSSALRHAHAVAADGVTERQLAGRALNQIEAQLADEQFTVEFATVQLFSVDGERVTVRIDQAQFRDAAPAGWTQLQTDQRPPRELTGAEHLRLRTALDTIAETLNRPLTSDDAVSGEHS
ncbi:hypothetical protein ACH419_30650 [Streptomyces bobili]|uniref:hypothetical protein n=1 Tax=Streptomyces bobili TaxID=67280 RepID=UPI0037932BBB